MHTQLQDRLGGDPQEENASVSSKWQQEDRGFNPLFFTRDKINKGKGGKDKWVS